MNRAGRLALHAMFFAGMVFLVGPVIVVIATSFTSGNVVAFPPQGLSLRWWSAAAARTDFIGSLFISLALAFLVTLIGLVIGLLTALAITRGTFPGRRLLEIACLAPVLVPNVVIGFAALPVMASIGLLGSIWAVLIIYLVIVFPVIVRSLIGMLQSLDSAGEEAARVFGARPALAFATVTLPVAARGLFAASIFSFVAVLDEAVIINFIGGNGMVTFPMRLFTYIAETYDPVASVFASVMIVLTSVTMIVLERVVGVERLGALR